MYSFYAIQCNSLAFVIESHFFALLINPHWTELLEPSNAQNDIIVLEIQYSCCCYKGMPLVYHVSSGMIPELGNVPPLAAVM